MKQYILNPQQFAFMQKHHEIVELGQRLPIANQLIEYLMEKAEYKSLFGDMLWDDIYDRYEDTPGYDRTFKLAFLQLLNGTPPDARPMADDNTNDGLFLEQLKDIRDNGSASKWLVADDE